MMTANLIKAFRSKKRMTSYYSTQKTMGNFPATHCTF